MPRGKPKSGHKGPPKRRCTATAKSTRERCRAAPIPGGTVCRKHGGAAPQVRAAAKLRLESLVHPAIDAISRALSVPHQREHPHSTMRAADSVLDRTGHGKSSEIQLGGSVTLLDASALSGLSPAELQMWDALLSKIEAAQRPRPLDQASRAMARLTSGTLEET